VSTPQWRYRNRHMILLLQGTGSFVIETNRYILRESLSGQIAYFKGYVRRYLIDGLQAFEVPLDVEVPDIAEFYISEKSGDLLSQIKSVLDSILSDLQQVTTGDNLKAKPMIFYALGNTDFVPYPVLGTRVYSPTFGRYVTQLHTRPIDATGSYAFGQNGVYASLTAANNTAGLSLINATALPRVSYWVRCSGACNINVYVSRDNASWRLVKSTSLSAAGEFIDYFETAYKYVKVEVPTTGIDIEIEIVRNR